VYRRLWRGVADAPKPLGEHLRRKRLDMGLTHVEVAQMLAVAFQTVERWEHNRTPIIPRNRAKIIEFLGYAPAGETTAPSR
jgi:transcriptional regulator with XRE-family HTH domain